MSPSGYLRPHAGPPFEGIDLRAAVATDRRAVDQYVPHAARRCTDSDAESSLARVDSSGEFV
jgi:hypothetical protein